MTFSELLGIDNVTQTFRAAICHCLRVRNIASIQDVDTVSKVVALYGVSKEKIKFLHMADCDEPEYWIEFLPSLNVKGKRDLCIRRRFVATFADSFELFNFPFDRQV